MLFCFLNISKLFVNRGMVSCSVYLAIIKHSYWFCNQRIDDQVPQWGFTDWSKTKYHLQKEKDDVLRVVVPVISDDWWITLANKNSSGDIGHPWHVDLCINVKRLWSLTVLICAIGNTDKVRLSWVFTSWTLLLIDQDQPHFFIAQQRLLIKLPPRDNFKTAFPPLWPFLPSLMFYTAFGLLPEAHFGSFDLCLALPAHHTPG